MGGNDNVQLTVFFCRFVCRTIALLGVIAILSSSENAFAANDCGNGASAEVSGDAFSQTTCDSNYRDEPLSCEGKRAVWGSCPPKPMPHKRTAQLSFKDLSAYLWYSLPHPTAANRKYDGPMYRGTKGDFRQVDQMIASGNEEKRVRFAGCVHQIEMRGSLSGISVRDKAALIRLQLDNCANQYILQAALEPSRQEDPKMLVASKRCGVPEPLSAKIACQPLAIEPISSKNDYSVTPYIESAWGRMLQHVKESDVSMPDSVRAGTTKYRGYIRRKRGFGPFDGILGSIYNLVNSISRLTQTIANLGELAQLRTKLPDFKQASQIMRQGFSQLGQQFQNTITGFPGQIRSSLNNVQRTFSSFQDSINIKDRMTSFKDGFGQMREGLSGLNDLPADLRQMVDIKLPNIMDKLDNLGDALTDLPGALEGLERKIPNISSLTRRIDNIGNIADSFQDNFSDTLGAISSLPGQIGGMTTTGIGQAASALSSVPSALGDLASGTNVIINNPLDDVANHINRQAGSLNTINNRIAGGGSLDSIGRNLSQAGQVVGNIPNVDLAAGGLVTLSLDVDNVSDLQRTLSGGNIARTLSPANLTAFNELSQAMGDMQRLENALAGMRNEMLAGRRFNNLTLPQLDRHLSNVRSYNSVMQGINLPQIASLMNGMATMQGALSIPQLPNLQRMANGFANNMMGMANLNQFAGTLRGMQAGVAGALGFGADINFRSAAARMKVRKDKEVFPSLPEGTLIRNPIPVPENMPDIKLSQLATFEYEQILDPTHPFSPRNHYYINDRDGYSPWGEDYSKDANNNVFCAGEREDNTSTPENEIIKVDVLESRRKKFETGENALYDGIYQRMEFNKYCKNNKGLQENPCQIKVRLLGWSGEKPLKCMECFNLRHNRKTNTPPCATNYLGKDRRMIMSPLKGVIGDVIAVITSIPIISQFFEFKVVATDEYYKPVIGRIERIPVPSIGMLASPATGAAVPSPLCLVSKLGCPAACSIQNVYRKSSIQKLCRDLRAPYTPLNKLKMRFAKREKDERDFPTQPSTAQNPTLQNELPSGVGDGLMHKDHFENRMPYPRLWDTGKSIQLTPSTAQNPRDQNGRFTSIVGVGREAILPPPQGAPAPTNPDGTPIEPRKDERCLIGGWGEDYNSSLLDIKQHDPITSWTELKLYQARTLRDYGMNCIGRYERLYKPGAQEDHMLALAGGTYKERSDSCKIEAGVENDRNVKFEMLYRNYPKSWRGYVADTGNDGKDAFPKFPDASVSTSRGLDGAKQGDIIILPYGTETESGKKGLPILSYVETVNTGDGCENKAGCFITVLERNYGKLPDACGNTDSWGIESNRQIYKPGTMPQAIKNQINAVDSSRNYACKDNDLQHCELEQWNSAEIYRIRDERSRGGNTNPIEPVTP